MEKTPTHRSSRTAAMLMAAAAVMPLASHVAYAQTSLVDREIAKRAARVQEADVALLAGREAYADKNYETAVAEYRKAINLLPSGPVAAQRRHAYTGHLVDGVIALSQQYRRVGRYQEARELLNDVLDKDPNNVAAKQQLEYLDDPIRTNQVLTYEHTQNVESVRKLLYRAEGYYNLGQYDQAEAEYKEVLRIDRYNKAARRGMERVANIKSDYYRASYDYTRAEMLRAVDQAWEIAVPPADVFQGGPSAPVEEVTGALYIRRKLKNIDLPVVDFNNITVDEAIDFLRLRSRELDRNEPDPNSRGINFVVRTPAVVGGGEAGAAGGFGDTSKPGAKRIDNLQMRNVPLEVVLDQICKKTGLRYRVEDYAVVLLPATDVDDAELFTRSFTVPPDFLTLIDDGASGGGGDSGDPFAADAGDGDGGIKPRPPVKELLERSGVVFPEGATATFSRARSVLTIRNTATNLDIVEQLVQELRLKKPRQIKILTKFVEISQENTDELGFDWVVSPFGLDANTLFLGGGTIGNGAAKTASNFNSPVNGFNIPGIPSAAGQNVSNIVTGGNRSGDFAINRDSIDAFLNNPNRTSQSSSAAPGILSLTGLFSDGQVQMIMRGLAQKKGADVMTAPSIVSRSGEKATIEIIREFIYPTEYEPPELPNSVGVGGGFNGNDGQGLQGGSTFPVTPATPTAFETRNTGVTLEVEPTLGEDGYTIDVRFAPEIVEFEGFINYGSPIQTTAQDALGNPVTITITENRIEMPVFSTRRVNTGLTIYDGHTVAVGGLMREDIQNVEDKVPVLGDLPLVGRLFQSKSENHIKSNLIIFVTAQIIDATGQPVRQSFGTSTDVAGIGGASGEVLPPLGN